MKAKMALMCCYRHARCASFSELWVHISGLLSMNETGLLDFVYSNEIAQYDFSNSLVSLSACDTVFGFIWSSRLSIYMGFVQNLCCQGPTLFCLLVLLKSKDVLD